MGTAGTAGPGEAPDATGPGLCVLCRKRHLEGVVAVRPGINLGYTCLAHWARQMPDWMRISLARGVAPELWAQPRRPAPAPAAPPPAASSPLRSSPLGAEGPPRVPPPAAIAQQLRHDVVGQDPALERVAVAVYQHYTRARLALTSPVRIGKTNVLLIGPTGSGKTEIARSLARMLDVPMVIANATELTAPGYVGGEVERCIQDLVHRVHGDLERARYGIVFLDELDKKARRSVAGGHRDIGGDDVQSALLAMLEGATVTLTEQDKPPVQVSTEHVLFICAGAFDGLADIIAARLKRGHEDAMGFGQGRSAVPPLGERELLARVRPSDLVDYGLKPELVGRLPSIVVLRPLDEEALVRVLTEPRSSLVRQYQELLKAERVALEFTPDALRAIARQALDEGTGGRGLRRIMQGVLHPALFRLPTAVWVGHPPPAALAPMVITAEMVSGERDLWGRQPEAVSRERNPRT